VQCVDAETLAAWADGGLPKPEAAAVELHLSECDRCTAMLATFVRTTPEVPAAESLWSRWHLRWLVPVATATMVAALWVLTPRPEPIPAAIADTDVATQAQAPAPSQTPSTADTKEQETASPRGQLSRARSLSKREEASTPPLEPQPTRDEARQGLRVAEERAAAPAPAPPASEADRADQKAGPQPNVALTAPAAPAAGRPAPAPPTAVAPATRALGQGNTQEAFAAVAAQFEVVSPDPMTRWRVIGAGRVERSTNGGAQWQPAARPESATLTGGSSPAPSICWLVGRTGAVYVTTDGLRFIRVPFPSRTDFVSIQATDGRRATVVTIDGRTMRTEDQGATWIVP
jgi:hypothetical protein